MVISNLQFDIRSIVTGVSVHAPIQRNSTYVQTFRRFIYETRRPEHPHSPISRYKRRPQGPLSCPRYMELCLDKDILHATATFMSTTTATTPCISTSVTITGSTTLLLQETAHRCISYLTLAPSPPSSVSLLPTLI